MRWIDADELTRDESTCDELTRYQIAVMQCCQHCSAHVVNLLQSQSTHLWPSTERTWAILHVLWLCMSNLLRATTRQTQLEIEPWSPAWKARAQPIERHHWSLVQMPVWSLVFEMKFLTFPCRACTVRQWHYRYLSSVSAIVPYLFAHEAREINSGLHVYYR